MLGGGGSYPCVWKTAVLCVAKLHDINAQMGEDHFEILCGISEQIQTQLANAVGACSKISESCPNSNLLDLNKRTLISC